MSSVSRFVRFTTFQKMNIITAKSPHRNLPGYFCKQYRTYYSNRIICTSSANTLTKMFIPSCSYSAKSYIPPVADTDGQFIRLCIQNTFISTEITIVYRIRKTNGDPKTKRIISRKNGAILWKKSVESISDNIESDIGSIY
eukprot:282273_1